jgi:NAD kinase
VILPRGYTVEVSCGAPHRTVHMSLDGQPAQPVEPGERISIKMGASPLRFIHSARQTFPRVLREKLRWCGDLRPAHTAAREDSWPQ